MPFVVCFVSDSCNLRVGCHFEKFLLLGTHSPPPPFLSAPLDYLLLSFHPCITGAERLFDYYVENKQRKPNVLSRLLLINTGLIFPSEISLSLEKLERMKYSDPLRKIIFLFRFRVLFFKLDRPYNVMLCNGCVKNQGLYFKRRKNITGECLLAHTLACLVRFCVAFLNCKGNLGMTSCQTVRLKVMAEETRL